MGWIGIDLDGTLAYHDKWIGPLHIGAPIPKMVERVKGFLAAGKDVRIFTARVSPVSLRQNSMSREVIAKPIEDWCVLHLGKKLKITHEKDMFMYLFYDDRCKQVVPNTGECLDGSD